LPVDARLHHLVETTGEQPRYGGVAFAALVARSFCRASFVAGNHAASLTSRPQ
jgi:hypothetical protein